MVDSLPESRRPLLAALAIYGVFALFYLGVPMLARRLGRPLEPVGGAAALLLVSVALLFFIALGSAAQAALWGLALLLAVLNAGLFLEGAAGRLPGAVDCRNGPVVARPCGVVGHGGCGGWIGAGAGCCRGLCACFPLPGATLIRGRAASEDQSEAARIAGGGVHIYCWWATPLCSSWRRDRSWRCRPGHLLGVVLVLDVAAGVTALAIRRRAGCSCPLWWRP